MRFYVSAMKPNENTVREAMDQFLLNFKQAFI